MRFGGIIAKLLGKSKAQSSASAGWGDWLDTTEGKKWEALGELVYAELEAAKVNIHKRRIILIDSEELTIHQVARRLAEKTGENLEAVREQVMLWLEEAAESDDEEHDDGLDMGSAIERWIDDVRRSAQPPG